MEPQGDGQDDGDTLPPVAYFRDAKPSQRETVVSPAGRICLEQYLNLFGRQ